MLSKENAHATLAVKDIKEARDFYEGTLGLEEFSTEGSDFVAYDTGDSTVFVYESKFAGTHDATAITWIVKDIEETVEELKGRGRDLRALRHARHDPRGGHPRRGRR